MHQQISVESYWCYWQQWELEKWRQFSVCKCMCVHRWFALWHWLQWT